MARWILVALVLLAGALSGCGSEKDKNINRDKDRPRSSDKSDKMETPKGKS